MALDLCILAVGRAYSFAARPKYLLSKLMSFDSNNTSKQLTQYLIASLLSLLPVLIFKLTAQ
jgi:hypothetical protein